MEADRRILRAKVHLQKDNPFFAHLVMNLNIKEDKETDTAYVDPKGNLGYNPKWIDKLKDDELTGVLIHEVLHLVYDHLKREDVREHDIFNVACDLCINDILISNGYILPAGCVPNSAHEFIAGKIKIVNVDKKCSEEIYNELEKHRKDMPKGFDKHIYSDGKDNKVKEKGTGTGADDKNWKRILAEAGTLAQQGGTIPNGMARMIDMILEEKVNWKALLYKYITRELAYDYTYNTPSKRSIATGVYMPSMLRENIEIITSIDTSGSISQEDLSEFLGEIINIAKSFNNMKMTLIVSDCEIKDTYSVENGNIAKIRELKIRGGGGTSHLPVYDWIQEHKPNAKLVINFTDGYTEFPEHERTKTLWIITKNGCDEKDIPFGSVIKLT